MFLYKNNLKIFLKSVFLEQLWRKNRIQGAEHSLPVCDKYYQGFLNDRNNSELVLFYFSILNSIPVKSRFYIQKGNLNHMLENHTRNFQVRTQKALLSTWKQSFVCILHLPSTYHFNPFEIDKCCTSVHTF